MNQIGLLVSLFILVFLILPLDTEENEECYFELIIKKLPEIMNKLTELMRFKK